MPSQFEAFAACQPGLEPLLEQELERLSATPRPLPGGVAFPADLKLVMRTCRWLGTASHVLLRLAEFPCRALGELQRKAALLPWAQWLRADVAIAMHGSSRASRVFHTGAIEERIGNAIATALGRPIRPPAPGEVDVARIAVRFHRDVCTISLDATSTPLHRRGYRLATAKAPLREDLAHALLLAGKFTAADAMLDPFCGSGTIAIEAAGLALGLPPGRLRPPALSHLALFDPETWLAVQGEATAKRTPAKVAASDRDAGAIDAARANAERAGVAGAIEFACCAFTAHPWLQEPGRAPATGLLATNPPFGVRVQKANNLVPLHQALGHRVSRLGAGWRTAILANDVRLARRTGLSLRAGFTTRHGGLSVTALTGPAVADKTHLDPSQAIASSEPLPPSD